MDKGNKNEVIGVIEIVLKHRYKCKSEKEELIDASEGYFGFEEPFSNVLTCGTEIIAFTVVNFTN